MNNVFNYNYYMEQKEKLKGCRYLFSEFVVEVWEINEDIERFVRQERECGMNVRVEMLYDGENNAASRLSKNSLVITDDIETVFSAHIAGAAVVGYGSFFGTGYSVEELCEVDESFFNMVYMRTNDIPLLITETDRTYIREITVGDIEELRKMYGEPGVKEWVEPLYPEREEVEFTVSYIENMYGFYGYGLWLVFDKKTDRLIGRAGLSNREINSRNEVELGYIVSGRVQRQGLGTEICRAIIEYARKELGIPVLYACIEKANTASAALAHKLGFELVMENDEYDIYCLDTDKSSFPS